MLNPQSVAPDPLLFAAGERGNRPLEMTAEVLAEHYAQPVHRFAAMVTRNSQDSADLAQEALVRALRLRHRYDPRRGTFEAWLWRIVVNVARDAGRAAGRRRFLFARLAARAGEDTIAGVETLAMAHIDHEQLLAAVRTLPVRPRTLVALRYGAHLSYAEIGAQLGISAEAALMATRRALTRLRRRLEESSP